MNRAIYCDLHRLSFWPWVWPTLMLILYFEFINFFYFFFQNWFPFFNKWQKQQSWIFFSIQLCDCIWGTNFIFLTFLFRGKAWLSAALNFVWVQKDWKLCGIFIDQYVARKVFMQQIMYFYCCLFYKLSHAFLGLRVAQSLCCSWLPVGLESGKLYHFSSRAQRNKSLLLLHL